MSRKDRREKERLSREVTASTSLPPIVTTISNPTIQPNPIQTAFIRADRSGLRMLQALERSPALRMAALPVDDYVIVANGRRMWTADAVSMEPVLRTLGRGFEELASQDDWRPVTGTERGLTWR